VKFEKENLGIALDMLYQMLSTGSIERTTNPQHFMRYEQESEVREALDFCAERFGLHICGRGDAIYLSPGVGNHIFGYTNEDIKNELGRGFKNPEMYTVFFIMHVIVSEFYKESFHDTHRINIPKNYLMETIEAKIRALSDFEDLDKTSEEYKFNFREIKDLWDSLPKVEFRDASDNEIKQKGTGSKLTLINETVMFMKRHRLVDEHNNAIYPTERFKAIVSEAYNRSDIQTDIIEFIEDLNCAEEENNAEA
jgi:hypothetical protein